MYASSDPLIHHLEHLTTLPYRQTHYEETMFYPLTYIVCSPDLKQGHSISLSVLNPLFYTFSSTYQLAYSQCGLYIYLGERGVLLLETGFQNMRWNLNRHQIYLAQCVSI